MDNNHWTDVLELLDRPAFAVENGKISWANQGALASLMGQDIHPMLATGRTEYQHLGAESLCLTLQLADTQCGAAVRRLSQDAILFLLDEDADTEALRALSLAAQKLRTPLSSILNAAEQLFPQLNLDESLFLRRQVANIHQGAYQILRIVGNMADASEYLGGVAAHRERTSCCSFFQEFFEKAAVYGASLDIAVKFTPLKSEILLDIDRPRMERAIYNLLSNTLRFTPQGGTVRAWLTQGPGQVVLHLLDDGEGLHQQVHSTLFSRYRRAPDLEDNRFGLGLGLLLARQVAAMHGGALLIGPGREGGTEIALSMDRTLAPLEALHSPVMVVDYAGGRSTGLVELSGELPKEFFYNLYDAT